MKRINAYLLMLLIFCCANFIPVDAYAGGEEDSPLSLPQGVYSVRDTQQPQNPASNGMKLADEEAAIVEPIHDETITIPQEVKTKPALPLKSSHESDVFKDASLSVEKGQEEHSLQKDGLAELRAYVDKSGITIGEKVTYTLEIDADNDLKVEFPSHMSGLGGFAVKDFGKDEKKIGRRRSRKKQWYLLDTYTIGSYIIPEQRVKVTLPDGQAQVLRSPQIFVEVNSTIDNENEEAGLRDIKEPLTVSAGVPIILIIAAVLIILSGAGIISWKLYFKKIALKGKETVLTPQEIAFRELERIRSLELIEKLRIKEYYYLVSLTLRIYLENRFFLKAPEQTTEEFLESVVRSNKIEGKHINILKEYLNHCDLVKYAKFDPGKIQAKLLIKTTHRFIEETTECKEESNDTAINVAKI